jgi:predicted naringenin-chalcone synthase
VPEAAVLVLNLELCSLHFQETHELEQVLSFLVFADGCAASLVTAQKKGLAIDSFLALNIPQTSSLITWRVGHRGFDMHLSGDVPEEIGRALKKSGIEITRGRSISDIDWWAVHPGGRSVLDSVEKGLSLCTDALAPSRDILARYGNMSSATVMFVLQRIMEQAQAGQQGCAMSFGPGLTAETMLFHAA